MARESCTQCGCDVVNKSAMIAGLNLDLSIIGTYELLSLGMKLCWDCFWNPYWKIVDMGLVHKPKRIPGGERVSFAWSYYL